jgi:hypothetical protein
MPPSTYRTIIRGHNTRRRSFHSSIRRRSDESYPTSDVTTVVTLLSSSPNLSRRSQRAFDCWFGIRPKTVSCIRDIHLRSQKDDTFQYFFNIPLIGKVVTAIPWDSVVSYCASSKTIFHWLSVGKPTTSQTDQTSEYSTSEKESLSLLAIHISKHHHSTLDSKELYNQQNGANNDLDPLSSKSLKLSQEALTRHMRGNSAVVQVAGSYALFGRPPPVETLLGFQGGLPLITMDFQDPFYLNSSTRSETDCLFKQGLREIVIPHSDKAIYPDGRTLLGTLAEESQWPRVKVGLYRISPTLVVRPIPTAREDKIISRPSLVFSYSGSDPPAIWNKTLGIETSRSSSTTSTIEDSIQAHKIGYNGGKYHSQGGTGQWQVQHRDWAGLDMRVTDSTQYSNCFPESQDSLLAGSIPELQNEDVLTGDNLVSSTENDLNLEQSRNGDCWMEFRATLQRPRGYFW